MSEPKLASFPDLVTIKSSLESHRSSLIAKEDVFFAASLSDRLKIGLQCLKAHGLFALTETGKRGQGRKKKEITSPRDVISTGGFEGWLADEVPWLKKPTAYKYMTALKGLSLDEKATEEQVDMTLENLRFSNEQAKLPAPTLKSLHAAAVDAASPHPQISPPPTQTEFDFCTEKLAEFRKQGSELLSMAETLKGIPALHRAACARAYSILSELTGTCWAPSDEPDELASVDPDSISL